MDGDLFDDFPSFAVALEARDAVVERPASVAIHDNGNVSWYGVECDVESLGGLLTFLLESLSQSLSFKSGFW